MTTFYQTLTPYYDDIFPTNDKQLHFLTSSFQAASSLLDIGAGTGNTAIALVKAGYNLTAAEPEHSMNTSIREKADREELHIKVSNHNMQQISLLNETFDGIYCIGNTLPHLDTFKEICTFLQDAYDRLHEHGMLVIQTINFEKVLLQEGYSFPIIQKESFTFSRQYELQNDKVMFTTIIEDPSGKHSNTLPLYPVTKLQLETELHHCGFRSITAYGDYGKSPYHPESPALVIIATK